MIRMPVPLTYGQRTLVAKKKLDHLVDSKGCFQADRAPIVGRLEPVCCCERCYACLANPLIEKLSSSDHEWTAADQGFVAHDDEEGILLADPEWFSLYPCPSCDCCADDDCRKICGDEDRRRSEDRRYSEAIGAIACDSSPVNKKRMTLSEEARFLCPKSNPSRRPLADLQCCAVSDEDDDAVKRPDPFNARGSSRSRDSRDLLSSLSRDETHSWVQPPPNRTICHIVDDVTLERLSASSPLLTRCCLVSRKLGSGRQAGRTKMKNQSISR